MLHDEVVIRQFLGRVMMSDAHNGRMFWLIAGNRVISASNDLAFFCGPSHCLGQCVTQKCQNLINQKSARITSLPLKDFTRNLPTFFVLCVTLGFFETSHQFIYQPRTRTLPALYQPFYQLLTQIQPSALPTVYLLFTKQCNPHFTRKLPHIYQNLTIVAGVHAFVYFVLQQMQI